MLSRVLWMPQAFIPILIYLLLHLTHNQPQSSRPNLNRPPRVHHLDRLGHLQPLRLPPKPPKTPASVWAFLPSGCLHPVALGYSRWNAGYMPLTKSEI